MTPGSKTVLRRKFLTIGGGPETGMVNEKENEKGKEKRMCLRYSESPKRTYNTGYSLVVTGQLLP